MHDSVRRWMQQQATWLFANYHLDVATRVLEAGALNVNGGVRDLFETHVNYYVGLDEFKGPGVDLQFPIEHASVIFREHAFDLVISTEMLEHADRWQQALMAMKGLTSVDGRILLTTRSPGFPYHPGDVMAPYEDLWRFTPELIEQAFSGDCAIEELSVDPEAPGVFVRARRLAVTVRDLDELTAEAVTA